MQLKNDRWIGLIGGLLLIAVIPLSLYTPWWQLSIGDVGSANFSLLNSNFSLLGESFVIPLLTAINVSGFLLLSISAVVMIAYALNSTKDYASQLLGWSYKIPIVILITFVGGIVALTQLVPFMANQFAPIALTLPIVGTSVIQVPSELLGGVNGVQIGIAVSGGFQWTFYLALAAAVLCIATRILYNRAANPAEPVVKAPGTSSELV
jgi:hypothetical protein